MVAASASERQASLTLTNISCLNALFSLCLSPSPTSNCTANLATQLANGRLSKNLKRISMKWAELTFGKAQDPDEEDKRRIR
ncbi:hypothetical protein CJ030_MR1G028893 [Morella rubra]|uniref:Uncharacterized protein n=1 Tax=Morella rubra TaxID=262757 RepID=A0A6A1WSP9_9ROSI|nr:hypothetical protein CJ030_MR1G028893 [Morella rubra]